MSRTIPLPPDETTGDNAAASGDMIKQGLGKEAGKEWSDCMIDMQDFIDRSPLV
jgi:hypothetical protein